MALKMNYITAALQVCIDKREGDGICGRVLGQRLTAPIEFYDIGDFLLKIDALLDAQNFPQAFERPRKFLDGIKRQVPAAESDELALSAETVTAASGELATFTLHVVTRRGATWQGFVRWADSSDRQEFHSALELVKLVDDHLTAIAAE